MTTTLQCKPLHGANASPLLKSRPFLLSSFLFAQLTLISYSHAAPAGGNVVGGSGTINQAGLTTTVNQNTKLMAIDWQSYNVQQNERVHYIQPDASSISLNRILGNNASTIRGQIDANGQVILVNPNGIFFTPTATVNVGGLMASGLDIKPSDFMNGNYIFNEVLGTEGTVINSGIINAATGGSVTLLGKQVKNEGMISARLGMVNMAAGKEAVVTFDSAGLLGIKVTKEILQNEIGIDPAVLNSGKITAEGGKILLTASVSQDIFSRAVNTGTLEQATSAVVHPDGTFTLGGGADVVNSGTLDVSTSGVNQNAGEIVVVGNNVTSSGVIKADALTGNGGNVELHATDTTKLTSNSVTSARAIAFGKGGSVKVLGNKVGLFDSARVDVSGANGGGVALIGGDRTGQNRAIRNAEFIYLGDQTSVNADATDNGDGGKLITFASNSARLHGGLTARGGMNGGNGGFIETSGLRGFEISKAPDVSAALGLGGEWLIDPLTISIVNGGGNITGTLTPPPNPNKDQAFTAITSGAKVDVNLLYTALDNKGNGGSTVTVSTGTAVATPAENGDINFLTNFNYNGANGSTLVLDAAGNINTNTSDVVSGSLLNMNFKALGNVVIDNSLIETRGGTFSASGVNFTFTETTKGQHIDTRGGNVTLTMTGAVKLTGNVITQGGDFTVAKSASITTSGGDINTYGRRGKGGATGVVTLDSTGLVNLGGGILTRGSNVIVTNSGSFSSNATGTINTTGNTVTNPTRNRNDGDVIINSKGTITVGGQITTRTGTTGSGLGKVDLISTSTTPAASAITVNAGITTRGGIVTISGGNIKTAAGITTRGRNQGSVAITSTGTIAVNGSIDTDRAGVSLSSSALGTAGAITVNNAITTRRGAFTVLKSGQFSNTATSVIDTSDNGAGTGAASVLSSGAITVAGNITTNTGIIELNTTGAAVAGEITVASTSTLTTNGANVNIGLPTSVGGAARSTKYTQTGTIDTSGGNGGNIAIASIGNISSGQILTNNGTVNLNTSGTAAAGTINVNGAISTNGASVTTVSEIFNTIAAGTISSGGGAVLIDSQGATATNDVNIAGNITTGGGSFTANKSNKFNNTATIDTSGGSGLVDIKSTTTIATGNIKGGTGAVDFDATGLVTVSGAVSSRGGNVTVKNSNGFTIATAGSIDTSRAGGTGGAVNVTTTGAVVLNGAITTNNGAVNFVPGVTSFTADANGSIDTTAGGTGGGSQGTVTLNSASTVTTAGQITTSGGAVDVNAVTTASVAGIDTGIATTTGTLNIATAGAITANGPLVIGGTSTIANTGTAATDTITLNNTANDFKGTVALSNGTTNGVNGTGTAIVSIKASKGIQFATSTLGQGKFSVETSTGDIRQSGVITQVAGATTSSSLIATSGAITLADPANDFVGNVVLTAGTTVNIQDANDISFGVTKVGGAMDVKANNGGSIALGKTTVGGNLDATTFGGGEITQDLTANNGITMTGANTTATFTVDGNTIGTNKSSIDMGNESNSFKGVSFAANSNTGRLVDVTVSNATTLDLQSLDLDGNLKVTTITGDIKNSTGSMKVRGLTTLDVRDAAGNINLDVGINDFNNVVIANANNVSITDTNTINIGDDKGTVSNIKGDLTLTSNGDITQTAALTMNQGTTATFNAGSGSINLSTNKIDGSALQNDFQNIVLNATGSVDIADKNGIIIGDTAGTVSNIGGDLTINANGVIDQTAALTMNTGTTASFTSGSGAINLGTFDNNFDKITISSSADVSIRDTAGGIQLGTTNIGSANAKTGSLKVDSTNGNISEVAGESITVGGNVELLAANNDILLGTGDHSMSNVAFVGKNVSLRSIDTGMKIKDQSSGVASVVTGDLTLKAEGNIDDDLTTGNFTVGGNANLDTGIGSAINMLKTDFRGTLTARAADTIKVIDATALQLGTLSAGTEVDLDAGTNISGGSVTANRVQLVANEGITGISTTTSRLYVENRATVTSDVSISNTGLVEIESLRNVGNITFTNSDSIRINPGSIDSGYNATGTLLEITLTKGSFIGTQQADPANPIPDITAYNAFLTARSGNFGSLNRPLVLKVNNNLVINSLRSFAPIYIPRRPNDVVDTSTFKFSFFDAASALAGEQLIEVEDLEDIDPAIFSDVRNYVYGQVAIRLPRDQLFEDELETEEN